MTLEEFNGLPFDHARSAMMDCCGCEAWAVEMAAKRPFESLDSLRETADEQWWRLGEYAWLEALRAHPKIGAWSDVADLSESDESVAERMACLREYYATFGFSFIYYSVGKTNEEILEVLKARIGNRLEQELGNAAEEQSKVTQLKLGRLFQV
ncbi:MAG TPA: 2-oxo-4-hydroxy-4-carboxy-5-ureidoimidazoline decarboxylase [Bryobacteraceae bacterium]|jgi:2-oxo-4-hydroxy-4-carboxy-5-ureidoimidazoline decarboxylase